MKHPAATALAIPRIVPEGLFRKLTARTAAAFSQLIGGFAQ